jgi:hypothetical protein
MAQYYDKWFVPFLPVFPASFLTHSTCGEENFMRFCKTILYCLNVLGVWAGTVSADLSLRLQFFFVFKSATVSFMGSVGSQRDERNFHITVAIKETLMGSLAERLRYFAAVPRCVSRYQAISTGIRVHLF